MSGFREPSATETGEARGHAPVKGGQTGEGCPDVSLVVPVYNETETIPEFYRRAVSVLRETCGESYEIVFVDDGSTDGTVEVARELGVQHVVRLKQNRGLAFAFQAGLEAALQAGADVIVNTDADNQYRGEDVGRLVANPDIPQSLQRQSAL